MYATEKSLFPLSPSRSLALSTKRRPAFRGVSCGPREWLGRVRALREEGPLRIDFYPSHDTGVIKGILEFHVRLMR